ncbi:MAG: RNA 2',3'-cyclic phosphodiesterase [Pseudomonadota bacterium]|nr:RNA 2',3'-cyclic phosphodiesterase [Pseudomonadota bacterium]
MIRAFVALSLPEPVLDALAALQQGMPAPRVVPVENLHLTLAFLGEVDETALEEAHHAFQRIAAPGFDLRLSGLGMFGGARPRALYAGVVESAPLRHLQGKVETAARNAGIAIDARRFVPHVTLARLNAARLDKPRMAHFMAGRMGFSSPAMTVTDFRLLRSHLGPSGASYDELARYPLQ